MHALYDKNGRLVQYLIGFTTKKAKAAFKDHDVVIKKIKPEDHFTPEQIQNMKWNVLNPNLPSLGID